MKTRLFFVLILFLTVRHSCAEADPSHGISAFGDLKYRSDFTSFDYVNPEAPKGGTIRLRGLRGFDTINPFTVKGIRFRGRTLIALTLPYDSLMSPAADEPDSMYGLVAEWADISKDRTSVTFKLRPEARWHDGTQITPEDVVFSFYLLREKGAPRFRIAFEDVLTAEVIDADKVRFRFSQNEPLRDLPLIVAGMPILSKKDAESKEFGKTTFEPLMGSGPYRIVNTIPNRTIILQKVQDYWGSNLSVNRGRYNYKKIKVEFYRDRNVAHEAFKAGEFDFQEEFTSRIWATGYDFPAIRKKNVIKESLQNRSPAARQYFALNLRRQKFADLRVRKAINLAFDFEWTNKNLFYGLYRRSNSIYSNTNMSALQAPDQLELVLFEKFSSTIPQYVLDNVYIPPLTNGSGDNRRNLQTAQTLFSEAGWNVANGKLVDASGEVFNIEFLLISPSFERIIAPIIKNLGRIGVQATMRVVDPAQYTKRVREDFDFDIITAAFGVSPTPGVNERAFWHSSTANLPGGVNYGGIKDPIVDYLLENLASATDRQSMITSARALDRTLMANLYVIPQWYRDIYTVAYWNIFGRPKVLPTYSLGMIDTWWIDQEKAVLAQPSLRTLKD